MEESLRSNFIAKNDAYYNALRDLIMFHHDDDAHYEHYPAGYFKYESGKEAAFEKARDRALQEMLDAWFILQAYRLTTGAIRNTL